MILFTIRGAPESNLSSQIGCPDVQYFLQSLQADVNLSTLSLATAVSFQGLGRLRIVTRQQLVRPRNRRSVLWKGSDFHLHSVRHGSGAYSVGPGWVSGRCVKLMMTFLNYGDWLCVERYHHPPNIVTVSLIKHRNKFTSTMPVAARLRGLRVRIPPGAWMSVSCECCVLSGRVFCDGPITCPEESYRVVVCLRVMSKPQQ